MHWKTMYMYHFHQFNRIQYLPTCLMIASRTLSADLCKSTFLDLRLTHTVATIFMSLDRSLAITGIICCNACCACRLTFPFWSRRHGTKCRKTYTTQMQHCWQYPVEWLGLTTFKSKRPSKLDTIEVSKRAYGYVERNNKKASIRWQDSAPSISGGT